MSLQNFASKIDSIPSVSNVVYDESEDHVEVIFKSNPKYCSKQIIEIRDNYPAVKQLKEKTENENTILVYSN
jgi:hypothetical protein